MKWLAIALIGALACGAHAAPAKGKKPAATPAKKEKQRPDWFPLPDGATWKYAYRTPGGAGGGFAHKVLKHRTDAGADQIGVEMRTPQGMVLLTWYSRDAAWILVHGQENPGQPAPPTTYTPPRQLLKRDAKAGDRWSWTGTGPMGTQIVEDNVVDGVEDVSVPAGKFKALKVSTTAVQGGATVKKTFWFASGVGMVRSETDASGVKSAAELVESSLVKKR